MRKQDSEDTQWALESYRQLSRGVYGDHFGPSTTDVHDFVNDESQEQVENQFQKLAERFNEFFGHPSKI